MLTWKDVSSKEYNLLKRKSEMTGANGKSTMNIDMSITNEVNETIVKTDRG